ncbi:hypothetical protein BV20DRAFT_953211, partial [Pilatotrama ljubarskyi]
MSVPVRLPPGAQPRPRRPRAPLPGAETGRPETSREFAKRIKRLTVHGPREQREEGTSREGLTSPPHISEMSTSAPSVPNTANADLHQGSALDNDPSIASAHEQGAAPVEFLTYLTENTEGVDLLGVLRGRYTEDKFFQAILEQPKQFKNFRCEGGLVYLKDNSREVLCIPDVLVNERSVREIVILHAHSLLAHLGPYKTLSMLRDHVWWKT